MALTAAWRYAAPAPTPMTTIAETPISTPGPSVKAALSLVASSFTDFLGVVSVLNVQRGGPTRYRRWPHLLALARRLERGESVVVLKARQLGVTWLMASYILWAAMFRADQLVLVISKGQVDSNEVIRKVRFIHDHLPWWARAPLLKQLMPSTGVAELTFGNGSRILSMPATENAGRGLTANIVFVDEAAFHPFATTNYASYRPAIADGGQLVMVSTSAGPHGLFHDLYKAAQRGDSTYRAVFLPWWSRPSRQRPLTDAQGRFLDAEGHIVDAVEQAEKVASEAWLLREKGNYAHMPAQFRHEYPATEGEAWSAAAGLVYGIDTDGISIFSHEDHPRGNISPDPCGWDDCWMHFAGVDWGGGAPTAVGCYGLLKSGRLHKFSELHFVGPCSVDDIAQYLDTWAPKLGWDDILCGADEPVSIQSLRNMGFPARAAITKRGEGFGHCKDLLKGPRFLRTDGTLTDPIRRATFNPETCPFSIGEFDSYYHDVRKDKITGESYATKTPQDHHGDHCDEFRYVATWVMRDEFAMRDTMAAAYEFVEA